MITPPSQYHIIPLGKAKPKTPEDITFIIKVLRFEGWPTCSELQIQVPWKLHKSWCIWKLHDHSMSNRAQANPCLCTAQFNYIYLILIASPSSSSKSQRVKFKKGKGNLIGQFNGPPTGSYHPKNFWMFWVGIHGVQLTYTVKLYKGRLVVQ